MLTQPSVVQPALPIGCTAEAGATRRSANIAMIVVRTAESMDATPELQPH